VRIALSASALCDWIARVPMSRDHQNPKRSGLSRGASFDAVAMAGEAGDGAVRR
jgi:hypothetical protein